MPNHKVYNWERSYISALQMCKCQCCSSRASLKYGAHSDSPKPTARGMHLSGTGLLWQQPSENRICEPRFFCTSRNSIFVLRPLPQEKAFSIQTFKLTLERYRQLITAAYLFTPEFCWRISAHGSKRIIQKIEVVSLSENIYCERQPILQFQLNPLQLVVPNGWNINIPAQCN